MILYYTYKQKTKVFAQALGDVLGLPTQELVSDINNRSRFGFICKTLQLVFARKAYPVANMPDAIPTEIFVCSPVWGGRVSAPVKYFLENIDLRGVRVHLLLTAAVPTEKYKTTAQEYLRSLGCYLGEVYLFHTSDKFMPDRDVLAEQLRGLIDGAE